MAWFLYLYSFLLVAGGAFFILYTSETRRYAGELLEGGSQKLIAVAAAVIGVLLMISAPSTRMLGFVVFLGILAAVKGAVIWFNPRGFYEKFRDWFLNAASDQTFRLFGIIWLIIGTAMFSWI
ncbi:MAG: hypothetical protein PVG78_09840 [Desulfobacterales bacterium]